jgi:hypothetical protein
VRSFFIFSSALALISAGCSSSDSGASPPSDSGVALDATNDVVAADTDSSATQNDDVVTDGAHGCAGGWCRVEVPYGLLRTTSSALLLVSGDDSGTSSVAGRVRKVSSTGALADVGMALTGSVRDAMPLDATRWLATGSIFGNGQIYAFDGSAWNATPITIDEAAGGGALKFPRQLWAADAEHQFVLAGDEFMRVARVVSGKIASADLVPTSWTRGVLFGFASDDVWAVGSGTNPAQHWTGSSWTSVPVDPSTYCQIGTTFGSHRAVCFDDRPSKAITLEAGAWKPFAASIADVDVIVDIARKDAGFVLLGSKSSQSQPVVYAYDGSSFSRVPFPDAPELAPMTIGVLPSGKIAVGAYTTQSGLVDKRYLLVQSD